MRRLWGGSEVLVGEVLAVVQPLVLMTVRDTGGIL